MRVLFWNIRGVKKEAGKRFLQSLISEYSPDFLCLAEPMVQVSKFPVLFFNKLGYSAEFIHNIRHERLSNLWIIWKRGLRHPSIVSMSEQQLSIEVDWQGEKLLLSFIHASCFKIERRDLWSELAAISAASLPLLVVGDFNATLLSNEKKGPGKFNVGSAAEFQAMVDSCMLISTPSQGKKYTWSNNRGRGNVMAVLDRSFHNELWIDEFKNISQRVISCTASDHTPILIHSNVVKGVLKAWAKERFPNLNEEVKKATSELKRVQDIIEVSRMSDALFNEEADAKTALLIASKMQEKLWYEKAKLRWLKEGDRNTKFFHLSVKIRRSRNQISMLRREDGSWISDQLDLANYIVDFYKNFHSENPVEPHYELLDQIPTIISNEDNAFLDAVPSREEINMAIWDLDADSSPGPDGFPGQFFRSCWDIVENDFCRAVFSFFLVGKKFLRGLSIFLPRLISEEQGAFQRGKIISENISLASELANLMHSSIRGGGMGLKLDVQKAYDSLSWEFLFATLKKFGFSPNWINKIHQMLLSTRISILLNGGPVGFFGVERGLRQGDPISPILFILAEEVLCRGLKNLILERKMKALPGPRGAITPSHLLFADDIFIFMNGSARYMKHLHEFLFKYQSFSGQKINLEKSKIFFGKIAPHRSRFISDFLGIAATDLPTKYLGVEIFKGRVKNSHLLPLLDKIKGRLAGWKGKILSMARRIELVKSVISGIPIHNFSVYWWPDETIKAVERWMRNFIWSGKAGAGGVFRNENSEILQSFRTFLGVHTKFEAEMIAVITGLEFARDMGITHLWIECDSVAVVLLISKGRIPWVCLQRWMSLTSYLNSLTWKITHCMREANPVADFLAKTAAKFEVSSPIQSWPALIAIELEVDGQSRPRYRFF
ncbi:uncharacterized protein LOC122076339 [Macadamia integrifolia]|uniref:uncharacterized protein LOC122076339 n=1 Tax=Macadamia integrifolia TaxID=60698 RepID=UPI001C500A21|nr:uncharacterized protein LOC122076339 [Macadamia integrifolia]